MRLNPCLKRVLPILIILLSMRAHGTEKNTYIITCKSTKGSIELEDTIMKIKNNQSERHLIFKINNKSYQFGQGEIYISKESPIAARVDYNNYIFAYYIPNQELNSSPPFKGRIIITEKENGNPTQNGIGLDAFCR